MSGRWDSRFAAVPCDNGAALLIPMRRQDGRLAAEALIDIVDAEQATHRWHLTAQGYAARRVNRNGRSQIVLLHRELLGLYRGDRRQGDHIDGKRLDCRRSNLRIVTSAQNGQNRRPVGGSSKYRGVCFSKQPGRWLAYGQINRKRVYLGLHDTEERAAAAARAWRERHMSHTNEARA